MPCSLCHDSTHSRRNCPHRKRSGRHKPRQIVAVDLETDQQSRILLALAAGADRQAVYLQSPDGLSLEQLLDWIISTCSGKLAIGYFFEFDAQMITRLLPEQHLHQLAARGRVLWRRWRIRHVPDKIFSVTDRASRRSATIWNVSGWTQCSFLRLCNQWSLGSPEEREFIAEMKRRRADWSNTTTEEMIRYTTLECALLCEWFQQHLELHARLGIRLRAYTGAGSTAAAMIAGTGWRPPAVPAEVAAVAEQAFFGGRTETSCIGPISGPIFGYDINSAYPAAITELPEISGARWIHATRYDPHGWGFWRVRWRQTRTDCWGLFPMRGAMLPSGHRSISLLYPQHGEAWIHSTEVGAAMDLLPEAIVDIVEGWIIHPDHRRPFAWVADTAAERLRLKSAGAPESSVLKYGLNSLYGKMAQHTGRHPLQCMVYAAAITSATRARLLRAALPVGHDVLLLATDGILSTRPLDLPVGPDLGQWEASTYESAWIAQAGVYWAGSKCRTRGIDARALSLDQVMAAWEREGTDAVIHLVARRVLSYQQAIQWRRPEDAGRWVDLPRAVRLSPRPRRRPYRWVGQRLLTLPAHVADYTAQKLLDEALIGSMMDQEVMPEWMVEDA